MNKLFASLGVIFITQSVFADFTCDTDISKYFAFYDKNSYTCAPGYYLPANTDGCRVCDVFGKTCPGGTYTFNENESQGLVVGSYTCNSGYFLPANSDTCSACPNGFSCPGGTFEFNVDEFQGLSFESVPNNTMNNVCAVNFPQKIFAVYEPNTITVNWDDGTNTTQNTCVYGQSITLPPTPVRPGYVFGGWRIKNQN